MDNLRPDAAPDWTIWNRSPVWQSAEWSILNRISGRGGQFQTRLGPEPANSKPAKAFGNEKWSVSGQVRVCSQGQIPPEYHRPAE